MKNRCGCLCCIKTIETKDKLYLYFLGVHTEDSHSTDKSAFLKVKQIQSIVDGVKYAPQQSATLLRRNMQLCAQSSPEKAIDPKLLRSVQHRVKSVRKELTIQRLAGFAIDDSYGNLLKFSLENNWSDFISTYSRRSSLPMKSRPPGILFTLISRVCGGCSTRSAQVERRCYFQFLLLKG